MEKLFEELDKLPPQSTPLQRRIQEIETILQTPGLIVFDIPGQRENAIAVLESYKSGNLQFIPGQYYIFKSGKLLAGSKPMSPSMIDDIINEYSSLREVWIERVSLYLYSPISSITNIQCDNTPRYLFPAFRGTLYPTGSHHMVC